LGFVPVRAKSYRFVSTFTEPGDAEDPALELAEAIDEAEPDAADPVPDDLAAPDDEAVAVEREPLELLRGRLVDPAVKSEAGFDVATPPSGPGPSAEEDDREFPQPLTSEA
jgi:hypothetical protein